MMIRDYGLETKFCRLAEAQEFYLLRVIEAGQIRREMLLAQPNWSYPASAEAGDGVTVPYEIHVAQVSDTFGPGPFTKVDIHD